MKIETKYWVGDKVLIYSKGEIVEKVIKRVLVNIVDKISDDEICYQFEGDCNLHGCGTSEKEVYTSPQELVDKLQKWINIREEQMEKLKKYLKEKEAKND